MRCAACRPLLSKYVDGEALPEEHRQVERHISRCANCTALLIDFRRSGSALASLPIYRPETRLRTGLMSRLDTRDATRSDEVPITRRLVPARAQTPAPNRLRAFGNLASAFALVIVLAGVALLWQIAGPGPVPAMASPTITSNSRLPNIPVPTQPARLIGGAPSAQPTVVSKITAAGSEPSATTNGLTDTAQSIRDESYGYTIQYPGTWWTAQGVPASGILAHRLLRSWRTQAGDAGNMAVDVFARNAAVAEQAAVQSWSEQGAQITALTGTVAGLAGFSTVSESRGRRLRSVYLFDRSLVYRLSVESALPASAPPNSQATGSDGPTTIFDAVLSGFRPAADAVSRTIGYAPALFLHSGDLWQAAREGAAPERLTQGGSVRGFALSPDLAHVALLLASSPGASKADSLEVRTIDGKSVSRHWQTAEIRSVAWYSDRELLALGGSSLGLYGVALAPGEPKLLGDPALLFDLSKLPGGAPDAHDLLIAPDRRWVSFMAGADLYGVMPDTGYWRSLLPTSGARPSVSAYAWMPPVDADAVPRLLLLAGKQIESLALPADTQEPVVAPMASVSASTADLAVAPNGALAVMDQAGGLLLGRTGAESPYRPMALPAGSPVGGSLAWCANGRYLIYRRAAGQTEHLMMLDVTGQQPRTLTDAPLATH